MIHIQVSGEMAFGQHMRLLADEIYKKQCNPESVGLEVQDEIEIVPCDRPALSTRGCKALCILILLDKGEPKEKGEFLERIIRNYYKPPTGKKRLDENTDLSILVFKSA